MPDPAPTHRFRPSRCPHCGYTMDAAATLDDASSRPTNGDLSVCFGCGEVLRFDRKLRLRAITAAEIAALNPEEAADLYRHQQAVRSFLASDA